jgi:TonB family protein
VRLDSPAVLATVGTLAIHVLIAMLGDVLLQSIPPPKHDPPAKLQLVDVEIKRPLPPAPPPPTTTPEVQPEAPKQEAPKQAPRPQRVARTTTPPPPATEPPPTTPPSPDSGGGTPITTMGDIAPAAVAHAAQGKPSHGTGGKGGTGTGTGSGAGAGSSDAPPAPMSVATIKKRALPKGDFSYFDASKDYPPEAKQLGIEGVIRVRLIVDDTGKVKSAVLLNKLGHGLDELALARAKKIEFDPATDTDDKPVTSVVIWTFNMTLPK